MNARLPDNIAPVPDDVAVTVVEALEPQELAA